MLTQETSHMVKLLRVKKTSLNQVEPSKNTRRRYLKAKKPQLSRKKADAVARLVRLLVIIAEGKLGKVGIKQNCV